MKIKTSDTAELVIDALKAGLVPMLHSSPGIGKSSIAHQVADKFNLKVIDIRLASYDPVDLNGFPTVNKDINKGQYLPMDVFPIETDELPTNEEGKPYEGWLVLLDELTSAALSVQGAAYKLILDRYVGMYKLHPNVCMMAAGNLMSDGAVVSRVSTALQSRMVHFEIEVDADAWLSWATSNDIDHRIVSFIRYKPELLHRFDPRHDDKTFACPRTWEFLSDIVKRMDAIAPNKIPLLAGCVGEGAGREFYGFCGVFKRLPSVDQIINSPESVTIPDNEPSVSYAITGIIAKHFKDTNCSQLMKLVNRLGVEFQVITLKEILKNKPNYMSLPEIEDWVNVHAQKL